MLVYQSQTRVFQIRNGKKFIFPNRAKVELKLSPPEAFGSGGMSSRTVVRARECQIQFDANSGRCQAESNPPLDRLDVFLQYDDGHFALDGDVLTTEFDCFDFKTLSQTVQRLRWMIPPLLNLQFADPPTVLHVTGTLGDVEFLWVHERSEWLISMRTVTADALERHAAESIEHLAMFSGSQNRRLAAALTYFHTASRLIVCGDSPWEFMAEVILNLAKCLEILFMQSTESARDDIRSELCSLGYTTEESEGDFIPILLLRNQVDVGHPRISQFEGRHLSVIYRYIYHAEDRFRELLTRVINAVEKESFSIRHQSSLKLDSKSQKGMDRLIDTIESRIPNEFRIPNGVPGAMSESP